MMLRAAALLSLLPLASLPALAQQTVLGNWQTPTGSIISAYTCREAVCLKILQVEHSAPGTQDVFNPNPSLRSRSLCNLEIGSGFQPDSDKHSADNGHLYDPKSGKTYAGTMTLAGPNTLKLRGYIGVKLFGRSETWTRTNSSPSTCQASS